MSDFGGCTPVPITDLRESELMRESLWHPYIRGGLKTLVCSFGKTGGKTTLLSHIVAAMSNGGGRLIGRIQECNVLIVTEEADQGLWIDRRDLLGIGSNVHMLFPHQILGLDWPALVTKIGDLRVEINGEPSGYNLVVLDTFSDIVGVEDENDSAAITKAVKLLNPMCESGVAFWINHHRRKAKGSSGTSIRGSTAFVNCCDIIVEMETIPSQPRRRRLKTMTRTIGKIPDRIIELSQDGREYEWVLTPSDIIESLLPCEPPGWSRSKIASRWPGEEPPDSTLKALLAEGVAAGTYSTTGKGVAGDALKYHLASRLNPPYISKPCPTEESPNSSERESRLRCTATHTPQPTSQPPSQPQEAR